MNRDTSNLYSKQIISTQKQYDFLESLTADIPLPPSRPATPPPTQTRRRRKQSPPSNPSSQLVDAPPKRKRRSPAKDPEASSPQEAVASSPNPNVKSEMEDVKLEHHEANEADGSEADHPDQTDDRHRRGWFDIVMGSSNEHDSSEDEVFKKRKYVASFPHCADGRRAVKDEDEDYVD